MGQQTLQTIISISGRVDNSFGRIGDMLMNVGNHIDALSQKMIDFGRTAFRNTSSTTTSCGKCRRLESTTTRPCAS